MPRCVGSRTRWGTEDVAAFVADVDGDVVSCALGTVEHRAPSPSSPSGRRGKLYNVVTLPGFRSQGLARSCVTSLLAWFAATVEIDDVELVTSPDGRELYESLGFVVRDEPTMLLRVSP